jgi:hypothetical protein
MKERNPREAAPVIGGRAGGKKIVWLVLDAAGYEITTRCIRSGVCPALSAIEEQGYLGPSRPPEPNCETPPALRALFSGSPPAESGIWGYQMPDYRGRLERSVSGFGVSIGGETPIWEELERRGRSYTLLNAAFRRDPVWGRGSSGYDLILDSYRNHRPDSNWIGLDARGERFAIDGAALGIEAGEDHVRVCRGSRLLASLAPGEIRPLRLSRKASAVGYSNGRCLFLSTSSRPHLRISRQLRSEAAQLIPATIHHGSLFRHSRREGGLSIDEEMRLSEYVTAQMGELALTCLRKLSSDLTILYFSLIDELGHVYLDQIEALWPEGRAAELLRRCYRLLDSYIAKIMDSLGRTSLGRTSPGESTLLVLSSDHGQAPFRRVLHINDLLVEAGLVRTSSGGAKGGKTNEGYDLSRSVAYYHPANCGQVVVNPRQAKKAGLTRQQIGERVLGCLARANDSFGSEIAHLWGDENDPFLLFLYPRSDTHLSGRYRAGADVVDTDLMGGQHLSPLCPTPWMQAMLAFWSPTGLPFDKGAVPDRNTRVKEFLLGYLFAR